MLAQLIKLKSKLQRSKPHLVELFALLKPFFLAWPRLSAMVGKEFIQMRRDKTTLGMMIGIPLIQLALFGFAIN